jgi:serine/threonine protein kinase
MVTKLLKGKHGVYELKGTIGEGGMGVVYRGLAIERGSEVAIKTLQAKFCQDQSICAKFLRGAEVHAELSGHPNIVEVLDWFDVESRPFMVMELVDGPSIEDELHVRGLLPHERTIPIFLQVLDSIGHAHSRGIIHRDIKPSNILLSPKDIAKMTDFDIGKRLGSTNLTSYGQRLGTRPYMSPEQTRNSADVGPSSDIYSLGATLYEMCTNRLPFEADDIRTLYDKIRHDHPVAPADIYPFLPHGLESIILKALAKEPSNRFGTAGEFRDALRRLQQSIDFPKTTIADEPAEVNQEDSVFGYLKLESGSELVYPITRSGVQIGRGAQNTARIPEDDLRVSRSHAWVVPLELEEGRVVVLDLGSVNGTFVNGFRVERGYRIELNEGDVVELGQHGVWRFAFHRHLNE